MNENFERFLDDKGRVKTWPSKKEMKQHILRYISSKFEYGRIYTEFEVNCILEEWHTFNDYFLLRRGLIDEWLLSRTKNGAKYWREEQFSLDHIKRLILENYDIQKITGISQMNNGIGSNSYFVCSDKGEFIFKDIENNHMNHPENENAILCFLTEKGIPVPRIYKTRSGEPLICNDNKKYHMQTFIDGKIYKYCTSPDWLLMQSAEMLGLIQKTLSKLQQFPLGISKSFFDNFTPNKAIENHTNTIKLAQENGEYEVAEIIKEKIGLIERYKSLKFDFSKMTCANTHGDFSINQIICGKEKINAVIDFTSACVHPICWEVIRSYLLAEPKCKDGNIDVGNYKKYIEKFLIHGYLNNYDIEIMPSLYLYQNLVCDYFYQYYTSTYKNRYILRENAMLSFVQCKAISEYIENGVQFV